ncbi:glycosyltransferase, partial [Candidatus Binatus sp.]|uniref:glycosyltransferase n=1 Tax=Candidatus Binatus sp. TaxID=2811406 RepID=UPI003BB00D72
AAASGLPREVRAGDDRLAQLCGCNMAITKEALLKAGGFDPMFTTAGDDVDLSWRLAASNETLAYAPGAVVIHERRATLAAYLRQQRGYGTGEGLLYRKYPLRTTDQDGMYAGASSIGALLGGARVYYGEFGRGLFQTVYSSGNSYADLPLTIQWIGASLVLLILGSVDRLLGVLGAAGIVVTLFAAGVSAASAPLPRDNSGPVARVYLWIINLVGPTVRSLARERVKWRFESADAGPDGRGSLEPKGQLEFVMLDAGAKIDSATILAAMRDALVRRGVAVAETDGFQSYDLELVVPPMIRVPINALRKDASIALLWRNRPGPRWMPIAVGVFVVLVSAAFSLGARIAIAFAALAVGVIAVARTRRISAIIRACAAEVADKLGISIATRAEDEGGR